MKVSILTKTDSPAYVISYSAGCCYGKEDYSWKRVVNCYKNKHMSVFEHASVTFVIKDISRACLAQLTRHRIASFSVKSQRYCKELVLDVTVPDSIAEDIDASDVFELLMQNTANSYGKLLTLGIKPEDARFVLPNATNTDLVMTMNVRELFHFFDLRLAKSAQWEIRELATKCLGTLKACGGEWKELMELYEA